MLPLVLLLTLAARCWGVMPAPVGAPVIFPTPQPITAPAAPPAGAGGLCSAQCTCGCNDGGGCPCQGVDAPDAAGRGQSTPLFGREGCKDGAEPEYWKDGRRVPRRVAMAAVEADADPRIPADARLPSLSLMGGADDARKGLRRRLEADAALKAAVKWQDYKAGDPLTEKHKVDGLTVYLQGADGAVMLREANLSEANALALLDRLKEALGLKPKLPPPPPKDAPAGPGRPPVPPAAPVAPSSSSPLALLGGFLMALWAFLHKAYPAPEEKAR